MKASDFNRKHAQSRRGGDALRPADLEGQAVHVLDIERIGVTEKFRDDVGNGKPYGIFNIQHGEHQAETPDQLICSGALFDVLSAYFDQEDEPFKGVLVKGKPFPGAINWAWMIVDPEDVIEATTVGLGADASVASLPF